MDWLALWSEFAQAIDNEQLEIAERIIYLDGRWNFTELSSSKLIAAARQIIRERVEGRPQRNSGSTYVWPVQMTGGRLSAAKITSREAVLCHGRLGLCISQNFNDRRARIAQSEWLSLAR